MSDTSDHVSRHNPVPDRPRVLFVCVKNGGKSQMASGLMTKIAGNTVDVHSAGSQPGTAINELSAQSLTEVGVDITGEQPKAITDEAIRSADIVITLGREAHVDPVEGVEGTAFEHWDTDEPSERGIDGIERMRLVRDDIARRVDDLYRRVVSGLS